MELQYTLTIEDYAQGWQAVVVYPSNRSRTLRVGLLIAMLLVWGGWMGYSATQSGFAPLTLSALIPLLYAFSKLRSERQEYRERRQTESTIVLIRAAPWFEQWLLQPTPHKLSYDERGFSIATSTCTTRSEWARVQRVIEIDGMVVLEYRGQRLVVVPARAFQSLEQREHFVAIAEAAHMPGSA